MLTAHTRVDNVDMSLNFHSKWTGKELFTELTEEDFAPARHATAPMCGCSVRMSGVPPYKVSIMEIRVSLQRGNADGKTIYDTGAGESGWWPGAAASSNFLWHLQTQ